MSHSFICKSDPELRSHWPSGVKAIDFTAPSWDCVILILFWILLTGLFAGLSGVFLTRLALCTLSLCPGDDRYLEGDDEEDEDNDLELGDAEDAEDDEEGEGLDTGDFEGEGEEPGKAWRRRESWTGLISY